MAVYFFVGVITKIQKKLLVAIVDMKQANGKKIMRTVWLRVDCWYAWQNAYAPYQ